jgi:cysteine desulfurase/selenocysteine lyase
MPLTIVKSLRGDLANIRNDFPILREKAYGKSLVYFDNAATSQKPQVVIDSLIDYYSHYNANVHRGVHYLSQKASGAFDNVRVKAAKFVNARSENEIIFTRGTTEGINLVAATYGRQNVKAGDEVLITAMEHHSNIVPWQLLCEEKNATLKFIPINDAGELILDDIDSLINDKTKIVAVVHTSNSLGTINPVEKIIEIAHSKGVPVLVDGAQAVAHGVVDVQKMDCDFFVCSSHKMFGPTGIGFLYGKFDLLNAMPPYQGGGEMISTVTLANSTWNEVPFKFEAGTPNIADTIAFGTAIDYISSLDREYLSLFEQELLVHATEKLRQINGVRIIGTSNHKSSVVSFVIDGVNAMDAGMFLDTKGIAVRTGQHCTQPIMDRFCIPGTIRASFMFYNTKEEIDYMIENIIKAIQLLNPSLV